MVLLDIISEQITIFVRSKMWHIRKIRANQTWMLHALTNTMMTHAVSLMRFLFFHLFCWLFWNFSGSILSSHLTQLSGLFYWISSISAIKFFRKNEEIEYLNGSADMSVPHGVLLKTLSITISNKRVFSVCAIGQCRRETHMCICIMVHFESKGQIRGKCDANDSYHCEMR